MRKWFFALVDESHVLVVDHAALRAAWEVYKAARPFEAVRILAAADKGVLVLSPKEAQNFMKRFPSGMWLELHDGNYFARLYPAWVHLLLFGHEAGEEVEEQMCLFPTSLSPDFNRDRRVLCVSDRTFSWLE